MAWGRMSPEEPQVEEMVRGLLMNEGTERFRTANNRLVGRTAPRALALSEEAAAVGVVQ